MNGGILGGNSINYGGVRGANLKELIANVPATDRHLLSSPVTIY